MLSVEIAQSAALYSVQCMLFLCMSSAAPWLLRANACTMQQLFSQVERSGWVGGGDGSSINS